ncbi:RING-H2 finger protein ATL51-like [Lolium rigidum]|uniref:RING-H2 finger protein ATL51-like n=1 Tax=Lolium rigidum TaxID=89674 RepID=UPI001F5D600D|nr:RING-H2 finger protein ATL51-like [Lolium rigidum]
MAQSPLGFARFAPPPLRFSFRPSPQPPPPPSSYKAPSIDSSRGRVIAGVFIGIVAAVLLYIIVCSLCRGRRARAAAAAAAARPHPMTETSSVRLDERPLRHALAASPMAGLPAFAYTLSVKHNVTRSGEETAACSVCLAAFQLGDKVRLLPACLHLYHAECIGPWLDVHSTCPICRSYTDTTVGVERLPNV